MNQIIVNTINILLLVIIIFSSIFLAYFVFQSKATNKLTNEISLKKQITLFIKYFVVDKKVIINNVDNLDINFGKVIKTIKDSEEFQKKIDSYIKNGKSEDFSVDFYEKNIIKSFVFSLKSYNEKENFVTLKCIYKISHQIDETKLLSLKDALKRYSDLKKKNGVFYYINLLEFSQINQRYGDISGDYVISVIKSRLKGLENRKSFAVDLEKVRFGIFVNKDLNEKKIVKYSQTIINSITNPIDVGGIEIELVVNIGISNGGFMTLDEFIHYSYIACENCKQSRKNIVIYDKNLEKEKDISIYCKKELDHIIENEKASLKYRPLYSFRNRKIVGYFSSLSLDNIGIDFEKIKNIAIQNNLGEKFTNVVFKSYLYDFIKKRPLKNSKLIIEMKLEEVAAFTEVFLSESSFSNIKIIVCLDITKGYEIINRFPNVIENLNKLVSERVEIALIINQENFYDYDLLLKMADYIVIDSKIVKEINNNNVNKDILSDLIKRTKEYDIEIISKDVNEFLELETLLKMGIIFMSGFYFSFWENAPHELEYSKIKRLSYLLGKNSYK